MNGETVVRVNGETMVSVNGETEGAIIGIILQSQDGPRCEKTQEAQTF